MAWYNQFPWTNFHQLNLDWILQQVSANADNISQLQGAINAISPDITNSNILTVGDSGAMFRDINKAVGFARGYCSTDNRVAIVIMPGNYTADIDLAPNPGIDLIGIGRPVITSSSTGYPHTALYTAGRGYFEGIEFVGTVVYGVHVEVSGLSGDLSGTTTFRNCKFTSPNGSAIGAGIGRGNNLACIDCEFSSIAGNYGLYLHNYAGEDQPVTASFVSCNFALSGGGAARIDDAAKMHANATAPMAVTFKDCVTDNSAKRQMEFWLTGTAIYSGVYQGSNISLVNCSGNNHPALQHYINELRMIWTLATDFSGGYRVTIPLDSDQYKAVTVTTLFINGATTINGNWTDTVIRGLSTLQVVPKGSNPDLVTQDVLVSYTATWDSAG